MADLETIAGIMVDAGISLCTRYFPNNTKELPHSVFIYLAVLNDKDYPSRGTHTESVCTVEYDPQSETATSYPSTNRVRNEVRQLISFLKPNLTDHNGVIKNPDLRKLMGAHRDYNGDLFFTL